MLRVFWFCRGDYQTSQLEKNGRDYLNIISAPLNREIITLLQDNQLPTSDIENGTNLILFVAGSPLQPTGVVGIQVFGDVALLRSLVVSNVERGQGVGSALVQYAEQHARLSGVQTFYLLTTTATHFFESQGYRVVKREEAPLDIAKTSQFSGLCPSSSAFMAKVL